MKTIKEEWQEFSGEIFRGTSNLSDALYEFEKVRIAIEKKLPFIEDEKRNKLANILADAEDAMIEIEEQFEQLAVIGNFIDEELV